MCLLMLIDHLHAQLFLHTYKWQPAPSLSLATTEELVESEEGKAA